MKWMGHQNPPVHDVYADCEIAMPTKEEFANTHASHFRQEQGAKKAPCSPSSSPPKLTSFGKKEFHILPY